MCNPPILNFIDQDFDNEVLVFAMIFRKELDPSFRRTQLKLRSTVPSLIRTYREAKTRAGAGVAGHVASSTLTDSPTAMNRAHVDLEESTYVFKVGPT